MKWTSEELDFVRLNHGRLTSIEMAHSLNRPIESTRGAIKGLQKRRKEPPKLPPIIAVTCDDISYVRLGTRKYGDKWAIVDTADLSLIVGMNWTYTIHKGKEYAQHKRTSLHRTIMGNPVGQEVDHINGNGLDNRRINLRLGTHQQNTQNRKIQSTKKWSKYLGVHWFRQLNKFGARLKGKHLGVFTTEIEAAQAYDRTAIATYGEYAATNFPRTNYE